MENSTITFIIMGFAMFMFIWEKIPLALTAVIVATSLAVFGVLSPAAAFAGFVNPVVILFVAMFVVGEAFFQTGMAAKVGAVVTKFAKTERQVMLSTMLVTGLLSSVLSNTGTAAVMIPVTIGIADSSGFSRGRLLMPMAFACGLGASFTLIGSPPNMIVHGALGEVGYGFGFFEFAYIGIPLFIVGVLYFVLFGYKLLPKDTGDRPSAAAQVQAQAPKWKQVMAVAVLLGTVAMMALEQVSGVPLHIVAVIGAIILVLTKVVSEKEAYKAIDLKVVFLFGGTLPLGAALTASGAGEMISSGAIGLLGENATPFALMLLLYIFAAVFTTFISNTATAAMLAPLAVAIAVNTGTDPRAAGMAVVIGSSMSYITPFSTPPNAMVLTLGGYKFMDYVKVGLPFVIAGSVVALLLMPIFFPFTP